MKIWQFPKVWMLIVLLIAGCATMNAQKAQKDYQQAQESISKGQNANALQQINAAIDKKPDEAKYYVLRAQLYAKNQQIAPAQKDYQHALAIESTNLTFQQQYAKFLCQDANNFSGALFFYNKVQPHVNQLAAPANYYTELAECFTKQNNADAAIGLYTQALGYESAPFAAYVGIVNVYTKLQNYAVANYYAQLYNGPVSRDSLQLQIQSLTNLLNSNVPITNANLLQAKLAQLKTQYAKMGGTLDNSDVVVPLSAAPAVNTTASNTKPQITLNHSNNKIQAITPPAAITADKQKDASGREYVIVKPGETLYSIFRASNVPLEKLKQLNNINSNNKIVTGQKIYLN